MTKIDYPRAFFFVVGCVVGCGAHEILSRMVGWS